MAWQARTIALGVPLNAAIRLLFGVDVTKVMKPSIAEGYYGNALCVGCVGNITAQEVVSGSLSHTVKMLKKAKLSVNEEYVRSCISFLEMKRSGPEITDVRISAEDTYVTDWRWLGFNQIDFGWGEPILARSGKFLGCPVLMLPPPKNKIGVMMVFCLPSSAMKALETEMHGLV